MIEGNLAVLGCGNLGVSIARGLVKSGMYKANQITLTKRSLSAIDHMKKDGFICTTSNHDAVVKSKVVLLCVIPAQLDDLLDSIKQTITENHIVISVVSSASIDDIKAHLEKDVPIVRAMPNTAIQHCESMTCLAVRSSTQKSTNSPKDKAKDHALDVAQKIFGKLGTCIVLTEEQIVPATALCACGIAFFCRAIRAAAQGGCEIGFDAHQAIRIAAQTAKGAATLLLENGFHPEFEIDKVTTPQGCTIAGLNQMEHAGFSSAMIKGIVTSADKAASLYDNKQKKKIQQQQQHHQHSSSHVHQHNHNQNPPSQQPLQQQSQQQSPQQPLQQPPQQQNGQHHHQHNHSHNHQNHSHQNQSQQQAISNLPPKYHYQQNQFQQPIEEQLNQHTEQQQQQYKKPQHRNQRNKNQNNNENQSQPDQQQQQDEINDNSSVDSNNNNNQKRNKNNRGKKNNQQQQQTTQPTTQSGENTLSNPTTPVVDEAQQKPKQESNQSSQQNKKFNNNRNNNNKRDNNNNSVGGASGGGILNFNTPDDKKPNQDTKSTVSPTSQQQE